MAYAPTAFPAGATLAAQTMRDTDDGLRTYLHMDVAGGDLKASDWIETRHVQPPDQLPKRNLQNGVTGMAGGRLIRPFERYTFTTYTSTGLNRKSNLAVWEEVPETALTLPLAASATIVLHWHVAGIVGPDVTNTSSPAGGTPVIGAQEKRVYIAPYLMKFDEDLDNSKVDKKGLVEIRQNTGGFRAISGSDVRGGAAAPYHWTGYGQRSGVMIQSFTAEIDKPNVVHVGLAHWSLVQRAMLLNWSVSVEVYYT
jgi:hypothetical protein